jgi:hypothetical protein
MIHIVRLIERRRQGSPSPVVLALALPSLVLLLSGLGIALLR